MAVNDFSAEEPINHSQKTLCGLTLDGSGSMQGNPIAELNAGLEAFFNDIRKDSVTADRLELMITTFSSSVTRLTQPGLIDEIKLPTVAAAGSTKLVDGVRDSIEGIRGRKAWYKETGQPYLRPWIILITDGVPDSDQDVTGLGREIRSGVKNKEFMFFALGVLGADMNMLKSISSPDMPPAMLKDVRFIDFFRWLSASMTLIASSREGDKVALPSPAGWMQGVTV